MNKLIITLLGLIFISSACKREPLKISVSDIDLDLKLIRFEDKMFMPHPDSISQTAYQLKLEYPQFLERFSYIVNIVKPENPLFPDFLKAFVTDHRNIDIYNKSREMFPGPEWLENNLKLAFKHYKYYFPDKAIPEIYTFISGFNSSILIDTNIIGIGLDRYLGTDYKYYPRLGIPEYLRKNMYPEKIPSDCMQMWASTEFLFGDANKNVINNIIYEGKLCYFVKAMMPREPDHRILGFTEDEYKWCKDNEEEMWTYLIEHKLLFESDHLTVRKLIGDGPFTNFFPRESPSRAAVWLGWEIVKTYMKNNKDKGLDELMENIDYQKILQESGYKPG